MKLLEIRDLVVSFKKDGENIVAADKVNLSIEAGSFTAIVGESGSGKSVTALSVCRLIRGGEVSGAILWHGDGKEKDLMKLSGEELHKIRGKDISYIFQDPGSSLNPVIKVGEQVSEAYAAHFGASSREAFARTKEYLAAVKIKDIERVCASFPHELSGGMNQRVMIAMALIGAPKLLIADEPTTSLDVTVESDILKLLISVQKEKALSLLFITHDLALAAAYAETIYVMQKGCVVEHLKKRNGRFEPKEVYTKKLFTAGLLGLKPKSFIEV